MKKLLGIVVLGLLLGGNAYAEIDFEKANRAAGFYDGDPNKNIILESTNDYIVIRNTTAKTDIQISFSENSSINAPAALFSQTAALHCEKNDKNKTHVELEIFDNNTIAYLCYQTLDSFYNVSGDQPSLSSYRSCIQKNYSSEEYKALGCKKIIKKANKKYPTISSTNKKFKKRRDKFKDLSFLFELKKRALAKKEESKKIEMMVMINEAKATCKLIGMKEETQQFSDCALKLYTQSVEIAAKEKQKIVHTQVNTTTGTSSSGNNSMTIYDPVRDSNALIKKGQRMLSGACTLGIDC